MRITYDPEVDAAYLQLAETIATGAVKMTHSCELDSVQGQINLDFDADGTLIGIEVIGAAKLLPAAMLVSARPSLELTGRSK